ncbi:O-acetyltransferase [Pseudohyphozyma bogoriensis]|nr:O-acetyltransferase [Pseudohyphozyma bogoriensis]
MPPKDKSAAAKHAFPTLVLHTSLIALVLGLAIYRVFIADAGDRHHCKALLNEGRWLDAAPHKLWQPEGCMLHQYTPAQATTCLNGRHVVFIGDSTVRQVFYATVKHVDPKVSTDAEKHSDRSISVGNMQFSFYWDPFLNGTRTDEFLSGRLAESAAAGGVPTLAVVGSGVWYLRYDTTSGGIPIWKDRMATLFDAVGPTGRVIADEVVLMPVETPSEAKLSPERAATIKSDDIEAMNDFLDQKLLEAASESRATLAIPRVFNRVISGLEEETEDGLHFSETVNKVQASILLNLRCNDVMPKKAPFDKTCCNQYPVPNWVQGVLLVLLLAWGPVGLYFYSRSETASPLASLIPAQKYLIPLSIFGFSVSFLFLADRTPLFLKENKQYDALNFLILCTASLLVAAFTLKPAEKDLGFLNREQTDEWKGWMQVAILIYHYLGASKISGIYNPIRACVAAYLFQTGYGHLSFFLKKEDFGFSRVANIVVRINLLTVVLTYLMGTTYLSYYFSPLVTMWFLIIWTTMWAGHKYNDNTIFLVAKILVVAALTGAYFIIPGPLESTFDFINAVFATTWSAKEWRFRVTLDMWIVWAGALTALAFIKIKEWRIIDRPEWPKWERWTIVASGVTMVGYMAFELTRETKFVYNAYHPYVSIAAVLAFCVLRNATPWLRSTSSKFFVFFGQCSLETFIIQFHLFIAGDTQGIIMMIPGGPLLRPVNFAITSLVFVFVSNQVAKATGSLTQWICSSGATTKDSARLPVSRAPPPASQAAVGEYVQLSSVDGGSGGVSGQQPDGGSSEGEEVVMTMTPKKTFVSKAGEVLRGDLRVKFGLIWLALWGLNEVYPN